MRIAVAEDCLVDQDILKDYLQRYADERDDSLELRIFNDGDELVRAYKPCYDLLLLDIEMARMDGMRAAERIRETDPDVIIIFITTSPHYAIKGYSVNALSYILKPVSYFVLAQELDRARERLSQRAWKSMILQTVNGLLRVDINDIYYLESQKNKVSVVTKKGTYSLYGTLKDMEERIGSKTFVRCNSCYLVNLKWVTAVDDNIAVVGKDHLQISRPRKKDFLQALTDYVAGS